MFCCTGLLIEWWTVACSLYFYPISPLWGWGTGRQLEGGVWCLAWNSFNEWASTELRDQLETDITRDSNAMEVFRRTCMIVWRQISVRLQILYIHIGHDFFHSWHWILSCSECHTPRLVTVIYVWGGVQPIRERTWGSPANEETAPRPEPSLPPSVPQRVRSCRGVWSCRHPWPTLIRVSAVLHYFTLILSENPELHWRAWQASV